MAPVVEAYQAMRGASFLVVVIFAAEIGDMRRFDSPRQLNAVRDVAWKAQIRLCALYRRLSAAGKKLPVVIADIAREMADLLWAIGRQVAPAV